MKEECLICKAPLEYLGEDVMMECSICRKREMSKTRCINGHYVCDECHTSGVGEIVGLCLSDTPDDPIAIITGSTPLMNEAWGHSNLMTSRSLQKLGEIGGPRCCKRNSYMSILTAIDYVEEVTGIRMYRSKVACTHMSSNSQCIGSRCPFYVK